jgi:hypothetical protein
MRKMNLTQCSSHAENNVICDHPSDIIVLFFQLQRLRFLQNVGPIRNKTSLLSPTYRAFSLRELKLKEEREKNDSLNKVKIFKSLLLLVQASRTKIL